MSPDDFVSFVDAWYAENSPIGSDKDQGFEETRLAIRPVLRCRTQRTPARLSWLGVALTCDECEPTLHNDGGRGWRFTREPRVAQIDAGATARLAGLAVGDIVVSINGVSITSSRATDELQAIRPGDRIRFGIRREGRYYTIEVIALDDRD